VVVPCRGMNPGSHRLNLPSFRWRWFRWRWYARAASRQHHRLHWQGCRPPEPYTRTPNPQTLKSRGLPVCPAQPSQRTHPPRDLVGTPPRGTMRSPSASSDSGRSGSGSGSGRSGSGRPDRKRARHDSDSEEDANREGGRGSHSSTSQLNLSALYGRGGARMGCVARVKGVLGGV